MNRINVLHLVEDLNTGGLERVISSIARTINSTIFNVKVWCLCSGGSIYDGLLQHGIDVEILGMRSHRDIGFLINLGRKMRKNRIHILHVHGFPAATIGRIVGFFSRVPVLICHVHTTRLHYSKKNLLTEKVLSFCTDRFICCSNAVAEGMAQKEKIQSRKLQIIYNGIDESKYSILPEKVQPDKGQFTVGCVASLSPHKGHRFLLEAAKIIKENSAENVRYLFAGDGSERDALEKYTKSLGLEDSVSFNGEIEDVPAFLHHCDVVVLPSTIREGLGLALIEAMAAAKPVVGTSLGGIPEVVRDRENGFLVPPKDPAALADALLSLLRNRQRAEEMGLRSRQIVKEKFSSTIMINAIEQLYTELFNEKCKRR